MALDVTDEAFKEILRAHFTPSRPISHHEYLRGRDEKLKQIERAFNSPGKHVFIHGDRGVGKTSLARSAANFHLSSDSGLLVVECEADIAPYDLIRDIIMKCTKGDRYGRQKKETYRVAVPGLSYEVQRDLEGGQVPKLSGMNEALSVLSFVIKGGIKEPVVVIDEFDVIRDQETRRTVASFIKHVSDQEIPLKFIICGIGDSLDEMIGSHLSTGRYLAPIQLDPIPHEARWEIIKAAGDALGVHIDRESIVRSGIISDGYPYYIHLIGERLFWAMYDDPEPVSSSSPSHFESALQAASEEAEAALKKSYELATQKYNDNYQEVLWALVDSPMLRRQITEVYDGSYKRIMEFFPERPVLEKQRFYSRMNALKSARHGSIIRASGAGWYEFSENRNRGYVRLVAERAGVRLNSEHHLGDKFRTAMLLPN